MSTPFDSPLCIDAELIKYYECIHCSEEIMIPADIGIIEVREKHSFCCSCGQEISWGCLL